MPGTCVTLRGGSYGGSAPPRLPCLPPPPALQELTGDSRSDIYVHESTGAAAADTILASAVLPPGAPPAFVAYSTSYTR